MNKISITVKQKFRRCITTLIISIIVVTTYSLRICYVNSIADKSTTLNYELLEEVYIENDFFNTSEEQMNGYSITVLNSELITKEEFCKRFDYTNEKAQNLLEYMLVLKVRFKNISNNSGENAGIDLYQYILQETTYINFIDEDAFKIINKFESLLFALRCDSEREFYIPFNINTDMVDIKQLEEGNPSLIISLYPNKKIINLSK